MSFNPSLAKASAIIISLLLMFLVGFAFGRLTFPLDHRFDVDLSDPEVRRAGLMIPGVSHDNIDQLPKHRNQFTIDSGHVRCIYFFPKKGVGEQNTFCFDSQTGKYLGNIGGKTG